jgi:hypothetical protein
MAAPSCAGDWRWDPRIPPCTPDPRTCRSHCVISCCAWRVYPTRRRRDRVPSMPPCRPLAVLDGPANPPSTIARRHRPRPPARAHPHPGDKTLKLARFAGNQQPGHLRCRPARPLLVRLVLLAPRPAAETTPPHRPLPHTSTGHRADFEGQPPNLTWQTCTHPSRHSQFAVPRRPGGPHCSDHLNKQRRRTDALVLRDTLPRHPKHRRLARCARASFAILFKGTGERGRLKLRGRRSEE